jgi:hypothetical protein
MRPKRYKICTKPMQVCPSPVFSSYISVQTSGPESDKMNLSRMQIHRLAKAQRAHAEYLKQRAALEDSDDDDGPQNEDAWLLEDLKILTQLYSKLRDREQLIALIFEVSGRNSICHEILFLILWQGSTADLLKDIITIFYSPLAQVYRAASIADSLGDMQNFINDLIRTVEQVEERESISSWLFQD